MNATFYFDVPVSVGKTVGSGKDYFVQGIASSTSLDRDGERMSKSAIEDFKKQFKDVPLYFGASHMEAFQGIENLIGKIEAVGGGEDELAIKARIYGDHPYSNQLKRWIADGYVALSVGGSVPPDGKVSKIDDEGNEVTEITNIRFDHVLIVRRGRESNPDTSLELLRASKAVEEDWRAAIWKSVSLSDKPWEGVDKSKLPKSCFLYVGDPDKKSTWKFPVYEGAGSLTEDGVYERRGPLNRNALAAAAGRLSSTTSTVRQVVEPKLRRLYEAAGLELPQSLLRKEAAYMSNEADLKSLLETALAQLGEDDLRKADVQAMIDDALEKTKGELTRYIDEKTTELEKTVTEFKTVIEKKASTEDEKEDTEEADDGAADEGDQTGKALDEFGAKLDTLAKAVSELKGALVEGGERSQDTPPAGDGKQEAEFNWEKFIEQVAPDLEGGAS